ncbi:hypothetical protein GGR92_003662 [Spirosoma lacussanchae]|uniref:hypothetical protein n=1 Tax=Spirosoma lacussanchae TaxID=1884249 RepID=UPI001108428E|nr:hypothetical protein [Spirosoma lacussanchae]
MIVTNQLLSNYEQGANVGHVARLRLLPVEAVLAIVPPGAGPATATPFTVSRYGLAVANGAQTTELLFPPGGCSFTEGSAQDAAGIVYAPELTATLPKNQPALLDWLQRNQGRRWVALFLDRNGQAYVAGEPGNGLRLQLNRAIAAGNSIAISLKGKATHPAWLLETFDAAVLFAHVDFDLSFDFSFNA